MPEITVADVMQRDPVSMKPGDRLDLVDDIMNLAGCGRTLDRARRADSCRNQGAKAKL